MATFHFPKKILKISKVYRKMINKDSAYKIVLFCREYFGSEIKGTQLRGCDLFQFNFQKKKKKKKKKNRIKHPELLFCGEISMAKNY